MSSLVATAAAADDWRPNEHPAVMTTEIPDVTHPLRSLELRAEGAGRSSRCRWREGALVPETRSHASGEDVRELVLALVAVKRRGQSMRRDGVVDD